MQCECATAYWFGLLLANCIMKSENEELPQLLIMCGRTGRDSQSCGSFTSDTSDAVSEVCGVRAPRTRWKLREEHEME